MNDHSVRAMNRIHSLLHRTILALAVQVVALAAGGCGDAAGTPAASPRLEDGAPELRELGSAVWRAITDADTATLRQLRLSEHEHNELVWPEQPAAREPSAAANLDLWWQNIRNRNRAALEDLLARYTGSALQYDGVECQGEPRQYPSYSALTDCVLLLKNDRDEVRRLQAFRYVIEMDGAYKVVRYYGDE